MNLLPEPGDTGRPAASPLRTRPRHLGTFTGVYRGELNTRSPILPCTERDSPGCPHC